MKILFLHPNFPAQFKAPCLSLATEGKHDILFLCQTHFGRHIPGIKKLVLKGRGSHDRTLQSSKNEHDRTLYRAAAYSEALRELNRSGWCPDVVISHCGWGCGIYVKNIWPACRFITYLEWWFGAFSELQQRLKLNKYFQLSAGIDDKLTIRNLPACYEMTMADDIVSPTEWQREQLPKYLRNRCQVIPDQLDRSIFFPEPKKQSDNPVLTYGTRGMEPIRGFPEFIKSLPRVLKKWPHLSAEIAGTDTVNYGGVRPPQGSWKQWAMELLKDNNLIDRVSWRGQLPLNEYADWLKGSWCHVYLSEPFVTSWSLIEACNCSIPMVATRCKATDEFSHLNPFLIQVPHIDEDQLVEAINDRIRFSACFSREEASPGRPSQIKSINIPEITLAAFIADPKADTDD